MKLILLFGLYPRESKDEILANTTGVAQLAADTLQWSYLDGFSKIHDSIDVVNLPFIGSYPKRYKQFRYKTAIKPAASENINYIHGSFINLSGYKLLSRYWAARKMLFDNYRNLKEDAVVIVYSLNTSFIKAATDLKKANSKVKICIIVPDLPEYMSESKNIIYLGLKKIDALIMNALLDDVDAYVLLSKYMGERLKIGHRPFTVVEGISMTTPEINRIPEKTDENRNIFYAGTLAKRYGILNLVRAFTKIKNDNYRLIICGSGDAESDIKEFVKSDHRIVYKGQIRREDVLVLQKKSHLLVNPRTPEGAFTKFSFPSKTMEYFASGVPVLLYKLPGIPDEYYDYCFTIEELGIDALAQKMDEILKLSKTELNQMSTKAKNFIVENKNPVVQCKKVLNMLENLITK